MTVLQEDKISNLIHSIAQITNIQNEQVVRDAALKIANDYGLSDRVMLLERLYFFLADGQERRFIVTKFRENIGASDGRNL